jgi:Spy/CpxP family protein refolding chaperone
MNPKFFIIAAVLGMGLFALSEHIQQIAAQDDYLNDPFRQEITLRMGKASIRLQLNGRAGYGVIVEMLRDQNFRTELGVSDEQYDRIQETATDFHTREKKPEVRKVYEEIKAITDANGSKLQNADEETRKKYFELWDRATELTTDDGSKGLSLFNAANVLEITLTPEQKQKIREVQLVAALSDISIFPPNMFEALGLTNAQKQEMAKIKKELESKFEKYIDDLATRNQIIENRLLVNRRNGWDGNYAKLDKDITEELDKIRNEKDAHGKHMRHSSRRRCSMY